MKRTIKIGDLILHWIDRPGYDEPLLYDVGMIIKDEYILEKQLWKSRTRFLHVRWSVRKGEVDKWNEGAIHNKMVNGNFEMIQKDKKK